MSLSRFLSKWTFGGFALCLLVWYILSTYFQSPIYFPSSNNPLVSGLMGEISARRRTIGKEENLFPVDPDSSKLVLFWTSFFGEADARGTLGKRLFAGCPVTQCEATNDHGGCLIAQ